MMTVVANILDPVHDTLDPTVWDAVNESAPILKSQHKSWITDTIYDVLKRHGYGDMDDWLDIYFTGSLTTFQYSDESDCDISLFVNTDIFPEWSRAEMIGVMITHFDGTTLPGTTHPMQGFVVSKMFKPSDLYKPGLRSGYDIRNDRWLVPPERDRSHDVAASQNADYQYALEQADKMDRLLRYEPDKAKMFWHQIHERRRRDQMLGKGDYSQSNIIYKFLNNRGLFPKLEELTGEHIGSVGFNPLPRHLEDHWLTWQPGTEGKGFILENGRVWTWPTENLRPMHLNRVAPVKSMGGRVRPETAFHINPDGGIFQVGPGRNLNQLDHARLAMADRRLKPMAIPADAGGYGHSQDVYEKIKNAATHTAAFFNDDQEPSPEVLEEFGPEYDLERQRRNQLRAMPNMMYHVAPTNRRADIAAKGLVPDAERINNESNHEPGVYLWEDPEVAMKYRGQGPNMYSDFDMYAVQVPREHLRPDPWFDTHHQDRAADFPGAWYTPNAVDPESVHPFYDSPWHPRTSKTAAMFPHPDNVESARQKLGLQYPVRIMPTLKDIRGGYAGLSRDPRTGQQSHLIFFNPNQHSGARNWAVWHELAHAHQTEKGWEFAPNAYLPDEEYAKLPKEHEAEQIAAQHADFDLWENPTTKGPNEPKAEEQPVIAASAL